jgi:hypothetical protein
MNRRKMSIGRPEEETTVINSESPSRFGKDLIVRNRKILFYYYYLFLLPSRSDIVCGEPLRSVVTITSFCCLIVNCLYRLASSVLPSSAFLYYGSSCFVFLMNCAVCFIIPGWPSNLSMSSLPFPISFIIFFLCSLYLRHSRR